MNLAPLSSVRVLAIIVLCLAWPGHSEAKGRRTKVRAQTLQHRLAAKTELRPSRKDRTKTFKFPKPFRRGGAPGRRYRTLEMRPLFEGESSQGGAKDLERVIKYDTGEIEVEDVPYYFTDTERAALEVFVRNGQLIYANGSKVHTEASVSGVGIFVMNERGQIFIANEPEDAVIVHASFLAGGPVAAAGEIIVDRGVVQMINDSSGHYRPTEIFQRQFHRELRLRGAAGPVARSRKEAKKSAAIWQRAIEEESAREHLSHALEEHLKSGVVD